MRVSPATEEDAEFVELLVGLDVSREAVIPSLFVAHIVEDTA